ncbi:MAG: hypothetical protein KDK99_15650 [Verrucomicrobiales bacterium]|nr:hypothetical protein [Verrucomicrobiales bacterium]
MENPYAPPSVDVSLNPVLDSEAEQIRKEHLKHEASIKGIGTLYILTAIIVVCGVLFMSFAFWSAGESPDSASPVGLVIILLLLGGLGVFHFMVGRGLRQLAPWSRVPTIVLSSIGLLGFPFGTIINGYFLYLVASQKGSMILSERYREIVRLTPHIKYRTSIVVWILLGILLLAVALIIGVAVTTR